MKSVKQFKPPIKKSSNIQSNNAISLNEKQYEDIFRSVLVGSPGPSRTVGSSESAGSFEPPKQSSINTSSVSAVSENSEQSKDKKKPVHMDSNSISTIDTEEFVKSAVCSTPTIPKVKSYYQSLAVLNSSMASLNDVLDIVPLSQPPTQINHLEKLIWLQERRKVPLWVQCCYESCKKWRKTNIIDPLDIPKFWFCHMNTDKNYNMCSTPEEKLNCHINEEIIFAKYTAGSIVWAKMDKYPWWPAIICDDPDTEQYYWLESGSEKPTHYHVSFFDEDAPTRAWISSKYIQPFKNHSNPEKRKILPYFVRRLRIAKDKAENALKLDIYERLKKYSFIALCPELVQSPLPSDSEEVENILKRNAIKCKNHKSRKQFNGLRDISKINKPTTTEQKNKHKSDKTHGKRRSSHVDNGLKPTENKTKEQHNRKSNNSITTVKKSKESNGEKAKQNDKENIQSESVLSTKNLKEKAQTDSQRKSTLTEKNDQKDKFEVLKKRKSKDSDKLDNQLQKKKFLAEGELFKASKKESSSQKKSSETKKIVNSLKESPPKNNSQIIDVLDSSCSIIEKKSSKSDSHLEKIKEIPKSVKQFKSEKKKFKEENKSNSEIESKKLIQNSQKMNTETDEQFEKDLANTILSSIELAYKIKRKPGPLSKTMPSLKKVIELEKKAKLRKEKVKKYFETDESDTDKSETNDLIYKELKKINETLSRHSSDSDTESFDEPKKAQSFQETSTISHSSNSNKPLSQSCTNFLAKKIVSTKRANLFSFTTNKSF